MKDLELEMTLRRWAQGMVSRYTWLTVRFEYSQTERGYLVSYAPKQKIAKNERFMDESMAFEDQLRETYGDDAPLFCDEERLFRLSPAAEVIRYEPKRMPTPSPKRTMKKTTRTRAKKPQPLAVKV